MANSTQSREVLMKRKKYLFFNMTQKKYSYQQETRFCTTQKYRERERQRQTDRDRKTERERETEYS